MKKICESRNMPNMATVFRWLALGEEENAKAEIRDFCNMYARAREVQAAILFDELLEIADDSSRDVVEDEDGKPQVNMELVRRAQLRVDTRKFYLAKVLPKVYGDKISHEHSGGVNVILKKYNWEEDGIEGNQHTERVESAGVSTSVVEGADKRD